MKIDMQAFLAVPELQLRVASVEPARWSEFKQTDPLHASARCFGLFTPNGKLVAVNSVLMPLLTSVPVAWGHRLVVLPKWRGKGIALAFDEWLGARLRERGLRYHTLCLHPGLSAKFERSARWEKHPYECTVYRYLHKTSA